MHGEGRQSFPIFLGFIPVGAPHGRELLGVLQLRQALAPMPQEGDKGRSYRGSDIVGAASAAMGFAGKATSPLKRLPPKTVAPTRSSLHIRG